MQLKRTAGFVLAILFAASFVTGSFTGQAYASQYGVEDLQELAARVLGGQVEVEAQVDIAGGPGVDGVELELAVGPRCSTRA